MSNQHETSNSRHITARPFVFLNLFVGIPLYCHHVSLLYCVYEAIRLSVDGSCYFGTNVWNPSSFTNFLREVSAQAKMVVWSQYVLKNAI